MKGETMTQREEFEKLWKYACEHPEFGGRGEWLAWQAAYKAGQIAAPKGRWVCTCGTTTGECIGTDETCGFRKVREACKYSCGDFCLAESLQQKVAELEAMIDDQQAVDLVLRGTIKELEAQVAFWQSRTPTEEFIKQYQKLETELAELKSNINHTEFGSDRIPTQLD
jgi:hypothetical protein